MAYDKFEVLTSTAYPLPIENVDTDQIIPARFLKATERKDFDINFFRDWRFNADGSPKMDFPLNNPKYAGSTILVGGRNFGSDCLNVGVLPVQVSAEFADKLFAAINADAKSEIKVDLPAQTVTLVATGESESFVINGYKKDNMLNGFDDIDYLKNIEGEITEFADNRPF